MAGVFSPSDGTTQHRGPNLLKLLVLLIGQLCKAAVPLNGELLNGVLTKRVTSV